jgi:hypothetical protein
MGWACGTYRGEERYKKGSVGKPQKRSIPARIRHRLKYIVKVDLQEISWEGWHELG